MFLSLYTRHSQNCWTQTHHGINFKLMRLELAATYADDLWCSWENVDAKTF